MLTVFGKFLRHLRIERGELIKDMANKLDITVSYLSAVETGKRAIPVHWVSRIVELYSLNEDQSIALQDAADASTMTVKMDLESVSEVRRQTAVLFAREFETLDDTKLEAIHQLLKKNRSEVNE